MEQQNRSKSREAELPNSVKLNINHELKFMETLLTKMDMAPTAKALLDKIEVLYHDYMDLKANGTDPGRAKAILMQAFKNEMENLYFANTETKFEN